MDCKNDFFKWGQFLRQLAQQATNSLGQKKIYVTHFGGDCMTAAIKIVAYKSCGF